MPIQPIVNALIAAGYSSLDNQARALGLNRSTAWTIIKNKHKLGRLNIKTTQRILENPKIHRIIQQLRSTAQQCKTASRDTPDEELSEYLQEVSVILRSIASVLEEFDQ